MRKPGLRDPEGRHTRPAALRAAAGAATALFLFLALAAHASAADSVYWANEDSPISHAALDGSGGADLGITGVAAADIEGIAIDPMTGEIFWSDWNTDAIAEAPLSGGAATPLDTAGATIASPEGVAIDPAAGRIYWASAVGGPGNKGAIGYANLDGSGGGGDLNVGGAELDHPTGLAIDPGSGRIYWANNTAGGPISYANLNGSGGGILDIGGAPIDDPTGIAIDPANGRIYWANKGNSTIGYADLGGLGGGALDTAGATVFFPNGVAVDPATGKLYWDNSESAPGVISSADADDSGGGADLDTAGATASSYLGLMALFKAPTATSAPDVSDSTQPGSTLSCSEGGWTADGPESQLYQSPQSYTYEWLKDGQVISGATAEVLPAVQPGSYVCRVTATNAAGSMTAGSADFSVSPAPPTASTKPSAVATVKVSKVRLDTRKGSAFLLVRVSGPGRLTLTGPAVVRQTATSSAAGTVRLLVRAKGKALRRLAADGDAKVTATVAFVPAGGGTAVTARRSLMLRKASGSRAVRRES